MKKIFTIFALAVLFFFCGSILLRFAVKNLLIDNGIKNKWTDIVFDVNVEAEGETEAFIEAVKERLPLKAERKIINYEDSRKNKNYKKPDENFYLRIKKEINKYTIDFLVFKNIIAQTGFFSDYHLFGNKILPNGVIDLGDGYITAGGSFNPKKYARIAVTDLVRKVTYLKHILDSMNIPLVFAQYPSVHCDENVFINQAKLEFKEKLSQIGVPVIDLTKECRRSLFYKTDHHWQVKTSIWAGQAISKKLNELYGFDLNVELLDTNNFTEKLATRWFGSAGEKVIPLYEKENFYIYSPKYATDVNWLLSSRLKLFQSNGSFDSLYHFVSNIRDRRAYEIAYPIFSFSQNNLLDGKKILLIGDSYNIPLSKFLALVFKEVNFVYGRSRLLDDYLANKPDVVVLAFSIGWFNMNGRNLIFID
jgi:competence protein ComGF